MDAFFHAPIEFGVPSWVDTTFFNAVELASFGKPSYASADSAIDSGSASPEQVMEWTQRNATDCPLKIVGGKIIAQALCSKGSESNELRHDFNGFVVQATSPIVVVSTGLVRQFQDEKLLLAILTHELGHYYRSHAVGQADQRSAFFYQQAIFNKALGSKPTADLSLQTLGQAAKELASVFPIAPRIAGQIYLPQTLMGHVESQAFAKVLQLACPSAATECGKPCLGMGEILLKSPSKQFLNEKNQDASKYLAYQKSLQSCLKQISIAKTGSPTPPTLGKFQAQFLQDFYYELGMKDEAKTFLDSQIAGGNLGQMIEAISNRRQMKEDSARESLQAINKSHIGYYTTEQEADEIATEWLAALGYSPALLGDMVLEDMAHIQAMSNELELGYQACAALRKAGWQNSAGAFEFPPLGSLNDQHHSSCFRAFNIDREIAAHKYSLPSSAAELGGAS